MNIPFNNTGRLFSNHKDDLVHYFIDIGDSGWWLNGKYNKIFSESFANYCGTKYCLPVGNGTDALELALRSVIDIESNIEAEVITVANAGGYTTTACHIVGVIPVYADILSETQLVNPESIINCLTEQTRAIVVTHLYGGAVNIKKIKQLLENKGYGHIPIIEDCAQAHGAVIDGSRVGSLGDLATFSFYPTKNLGAMGDAGAITTSNNEIYTRLKQLAQYGWSRKYSVTTPFGRNSRMDEIQAAILNYFLPFLDELNNKRVFIYNKYKKVGGERFDFLQNSNYVGHLAVLLTDNRKSFIEYMTDAGIATEIHYPILDTQQLAWKNRKHKIDPISELRCSQSSVEKIVSLPCFPQLKDDEIDYVCDTLIRWEG